MKIGKNAFFVTLFKVSKRDADLETILKRFSRRAEKQNEQKCGRVCSDSLFSVRNIRSISDAFSAGFWEGLGSILGGFSVPRAKKWRSKAV